MITTNLILHLNLFFFLHLITPTHVQLWPHGGNTTSKLCQAHSACVCISLPVSYKLWLRTFLLKQNSFNGLCSLCCVQYKYRNFSEININHTFSAFGRLPMILLCHLGFLTHQTKHLNRKNEMLMFFCSRSDTHHIFLRKP